MRYLLLLIALLSIGATFGDVRSGETISTVESATVSGNCVEFTSGDNIVDSGSACGGAPGGADTNVQFNDSGSFGGDAGFVYDGDVGIGTASPTAKLTVVSDAGENGIEVLGATKDTPVLADNEDTIAVYGDGRAYLKGRDVTNNIEFVMGTSSAGLAFVASMTSHDLDFRTNNSSRLTLEDGIPSTLTMKRQDSAVVDGDRIGGIDYISPIEASGGDAVLTSASFEAEAAATFSSTNNSTDFVWSLATSGATSERMRLTSAGNLGIGEDVPVAKLHVGGSVIIDSPGTSTVIDVNNSLSGDLLTLEEAETVDGQLKVYANDADYIMFTHTGTYGEISTSVGDLSIASAGSVGIGDSTPDYDLDVAGTAGFDGYVTASSGLFVTGDFLTNGPAGELTISGGVVTAIGSFHNIDTEADAASDDLDTINGAANGDLLIIRAVNTTRTVVVKDSTGNLELAGDFTMNSSQDMLTLIGVGTSWYERSRSDNGA